MAHAELERVRLLGLAAIAVNVMSAFLMRTLNASLRAFGDGTFRGEAFWLAVLLVLASTAATIAVTIVLGSCFWTHFKGQESNPFVGRDFLPAWADLGMIAILFITLGVVAWTGF